MNKKRITFFILLISLLVVGVFIVACNSDAKKQSSSEVKTMYNCPMHPTFISEKPDDCPMCGMKLVPMKTDAHDHGGTQNSSSEQVDKDAIKIDPVTVQNMGVTTEKAIYRDLTKEIQLGAVVALNETKQGIVSTKIMGWVEKLHVNFTGEKVAKGQALFDIYSPDLVTAQEEFLQALNYAQKLSGNSGAGADKLLESSRRRLLNWDISESQLKQLEQRGASQRSLTIYSPFSGVVLQKNIIEGQNVMPGTPLYTIADLSKVWIIANAYQSDLPFIKVGMNAIIELQSQIGVTYRGLVKYVAPVLDQESKTAQIRIEVENTKDYALKPEMFANVKIASPAPKQTLTVPDQAVIYTGTRSIVIVDLGNGYFKPQEIKTGLSANGYTQVLDGLDDGTVIVTSSQFLIDSESNLKEAVKRMSGHNHGNMTNEPEKNDEKESSGHENHSMDHSTHDMSNSSQNANLSNTKSEWICTMCPEVKSDKPGKCPKCGMFLEEKKITTRGSDKNQHNLKEKQSEWICTMCPEVKSDKPGKCPVCGMFLEEKK